MRRKILARSAPRLVKRNGIFYFRMAVARQLTQRLGRKEIKTSLRTADARAAKLLASRIGVTVDALLVDLTNSHGATSESNQART